MCYYAVRDTAIEKNKTELVGGDKCLKTRLACCSKTTELISTSIVSGMPILIIVSYKTQTKERNVFFIETCLF